MSEILSLLAKKLLDKTDLVSFILCLCFELCLSACVSSECLESCAEEKDLEVSVDS